MEMSLHVYWKIRFYILVEWYTRRQKSMAAHCCRKGSTQGRHNARPRREGEKRRRYIYIFRRNYGEAPVKITTGHCSWKLRFFFGMATATRLPLSPWYFSFFQAFETNIRRRHRNWLTPTNVLHKWRKFNEDAARQLHRPEVVEIFTSSIFRSKRFYLNLCVCVGRESSLARGKVALFSREFCEKDLGRRRCENLSPRVYIWATIPLWNRRFYFHWVFWNNRNSTNVEFQMGIFNDTNNQRNALSSRRFRN